MITLAEFLLNTTHEYNGHKQTEICEMKMADIIQLLNDLSKVCGNQYDIFHLQLHEDMSGNIYQDGGWNADGSTDRLILGIERVLM